MARRCAVTGKGVLTGNNVSHAQNKTRRRFLPNLQPATLLSETLGARVRVRVTTGALRTIEHKGGLDAYLLSASDSVLHPDLKRLKKRLVAAQAATA